MGGLMHEPLYGNIGAEFDRMFPGESGVSDSFSNIGFWGGGDMLQEALKRRMEQEQGKRQARTARDVADINAGATDRATRAGMLKALASNQTGVLTKLAEIESNRELQEALKKIALQQFMYGEQQHNKRSAADIASKERIAGEKNAITRDIMRPNIPFDSAVQAARKENPKASPTEINARAIQLQQQGAMRQPTSPTTGTVPSPDPAAFMKQKATQMSALGADDLPDLGNMGMLSLALSGGDTADALQDFEIPKLTTGTPQTASSVRSDYTSPDNRQASADYYADKTNYNPVPSDRNSNPMAKFVSPEARAAQDRIAKEYGPDSSRPFRLASSTGQSWPVDRVPSDVLTRVPDNMLRQFLPDDTSGLGLNLPARGPRAPFSYPSTGQAVGQSPTSIRMEMLRALAKRINPYLPQQPWAHEGMMWSE